MRAASTTKSHIARNASRKWGIKDAEITCFYDKETSGELRHRPGIDPIWVGVRKREWDLFIVEDASRLFRNETACHELIEEAVDSGMRVICINDNVDTSEYDWLDRLRDAARHHRKANLLTRYLKIRLAKAIKFHRTDNKEMVCGLMAVKYHPRRRSQICSNYFQ